MRRAQYTMLLAAVIPTALMIATGIILLALGDDSRIVSIVSGVLVLAFCTSALTGYILGSVFLSRGASMARVQTDFLSSVSHELRTPITSMRMFIETLADGRVTDPNERDRCLHLLQREMHRLEALVTRLIDLSKLEAGRDAFEHEPLSVSAVIDDAIAALEAATLGDKVNVTTEIEPDLRVVGDRFALAQAVTNLLVNAYKYTGPDKRIELFARTLGKNVELAVADNGPGIPRSEQKQIFERFERGRAAVDEGKEGSGLGLSIVSAIARAHNGTVLVRSDSRSGSRFSILLPRAA
jgi:two-component system phosphate regulon sensor histidine kinase PhoR